MYLPEGSSAHQLEERIAKDCKQEGKIENSDLRVFHCAGLMLCLPEGEVGNKHIISTGILLLSQTTAPMINQILWIPLRCASNLSNWIDMEIGFIYSWVKQNKAKKWIEVLNINFRSLYVDSLKEDAV